MKPWRYPPRIDFLYGDWLRAAFERGELEPWEPRADRDLTVLLAMVLRADTPLFGPPPAAVVAPVPLADVVHAMVGDVDALMGDLDSDTANVLLTLARIWNTVETGEIRSKDAAAEWALERLREDERPALGRARAVYLGTVDDRWEAADPTVAAAARRLVDEIRKARPMTREP